ncbi:ferric-chelate reductase [Aspergillus ellipticus CBS 707.79]|uniref:ferric-chelate reductase (NADPH) n=1 Tax=Aspergillus ellipticus CBS 707.79 TaxID=1448320 RepID=A0A319CZI9_9EURO|nr:ferric-chelate reductase [Aspergillus ellipticus CBS 707.79]
MYCRSLLFCWSLVGLASAAELGKRGGGGYSIYEMLNDDLARLSLLVMGLMAAFIYVWKMWHRLASHMRRLASFNNEQQRYFVSPHETLSKVKNHITYAPLFRSRHNREFQLSRAVNMGTLPSRLHSFLLVGIVVMNVVLCVVTVPYGSEEKTVAGLIRNRTGTMATVNLIPVVLMAGRNNPLIPLLQVSFDTFNLIHRWLARIVVLESIAHVVAWMVPKVQEAGWDVVGMVFGESSFMLSGLIAAIAFVLLVIHSPSPIRHAFYETFLHLHLVLVAVSFAFLWIHLDGMVSQNYLLVAVVFWALERAARIFIVLYRNCGRESTTAHVETLPGDAMRITLKMARPWTFKPGQHIYLYIPAVGWWTCHPFSVGWSESEEFTAEEKGIPMTQQDMLGLQKTTISLLVRRRTGFTEKLFQRAQRSTGGRVSLKAFAEGPYGSIHSMDSYGTVMLFAGGVGITHQVPFVRHLVQGHADGTVAARRVTLVWIIQSPEHLEWIRPWMTSILAMDRRREVLRIMLFITRPRNTKEIQSPSATVQMFPGRPNVDTLVGMEVENQVGAMGVLVCGNGGLSDDVRRVCRKRQDRTQVDFVEESFTW